MLIAMTVMSCGMTAGCMGPTTRVLMREPEPKEPESSAAAPPKEEVNSFYLRETIEYLSRQSREPGSVGEEMAADYIRQMLSDYGYETEVSARVVSAVKQVSSPEADIVIVASGYGSSSGSPGANDNASGVAVLLETARLLAGSPSDTEVRFVCFPGEAGGDEAARAYVSRLDPEETRRILGEIQIGPLGYVENTGMTIGSEDGRATFLGDEFNSSSAALTGGTAAYVVREGGVHSAFVRGQIPAFCLSQRYSAYEAGSVLDGIDLVNVDQLASVVRILENMLSKLMSSDTPSMVAKSRFYNDLRDGFYMHRTETVIPFGEGRSAVERQTGQTGALAVRNTSNDGKPIEAYRYPMKWFGVDQVIYTDYYFLDGKLMLVSVDGDGAGIDMEDMRERITAIYGEPDGQSSGPNGTEYTWTDELRRAHFALIPGTDGYDLEIHEYDTMRVGLDPEQGSAPNLLHLIRQIVPEQGTESVAISIYTDGIGKTEYYLEQTGNGPEENGRDAGDGAGEDTQGAGDNHQGVSWTLGMDLADAVGEDGSWRDRTKTIRQIVRLYGRYLAQKEPERYQAAFDARFHQDPDMPSDALQAARPDFAEGFQWYVLYNGPVSSAGIWRNQMQFFDDFEELSGYRGWVRQNLHLPEIEKVTVGAAPAGE